MFLMGFLFYDISQSKEFLMAGYKVGVVNQDQPWCLHNCGVSKFTKYDIYRKRFCEAYRDFGYQFATDENIENNNLRSRTVDNMLPPIIEALEAGNLEYFNKSLYVTMRYFTAHTKLCNLCAIAEIMEIERKHGIENGFFASGMSVEALIHKLTLYRFLFIRIEYGKSTERLNDVLKMIAESNINLEVEKFIAKGIVLNEELVISRLQKKLHSL